VATVVSDVSVGGVLTGTELIGGVLMGWVTMLDRLSTLVMLGLPTVARMRQNRF